MMTRESRERAIELIKETRRDTGPGSGGLLAIAAAIVCLAEAIDNEKDIGQMARDLGTRGISI